MLGGYCVLEAWETEELVDIANTALTTVCMAGGNAAGASR